MISVHNISKKFGKLQVLNEFNLEFELGNSYALMGPNGSGKTTLIKTILGMVIPDSGDITVGSQSIKGDVSYRKQIGYMPQIGHYPANIKIGQLFSMMKDMRPEIKNYDLELVEAFGLEEWGLFRAVLDKKSLQPWLFFSTQAFSSWMSLLLDSILSRWNCLRPKSKRNGPAES